MNLTQDFFRILKKKTIFEVQLTNQERLVAGWHVQ